MTLDAYASLATFRTYLKLDAVASPADAQDDLRELALEAASRAIDKVAGRTFRPASDTSTRLFTAEAMYSPNTYAAYSWITHYVVPIDDTFDDAPIVMLDSTGDGDYDDEETAFRMAPANNPDRGKPYDKIIFNRGIYPSMYAEGIQVEAEWGWTSTPPTIENATLLQASRFWHRIDAPFGVAGSLDMGSELRLLDRLDVDVALMVRPFKKIWGAV